jgi:uncharacterized protein (TIGR01244 family)
MGAPVQVTETFSVAGQLSARDIEEAAGRNVRLIVNNRPDGEEAGQPTAAELGKVAEAAGLEYLHLPVRGMPTADQVDRMHQAIQAAPGPALAFCRSGTRSILTWGLGEQLSGARTRQEVAQLARGAGYDLDPYLPR